MEQIVYDGSLKSKIRIFGEYGNGQLKVVCPKCNDDLLIVLTPADVAKHGKAPGIYCPNDHFWTQFNLR
jgi:hypothetical protein